MAEDPDSFESIVADYGRAADARYAAIARAEALERKAAIGVPEFRAIRLRGAERARKEAAGHEAEILQIIDRLETLQRTDATVPRVNDTAAMAAWRQHLRQMRAERAGVGTEKDLRDRLLDGEAHAVRLRSLDEAAATLEAKIRRAETKQHAAENAWTKL